MVSDIDFKGYFWEKLAYVKNNFMVGVSSVYMSYYLSVRGVKYGKKNRFAGKAYFRRYPNSTISFGNNCTFNSSRKAVLEARLYKPCVISTMEKKAAISIGNNVGATSVHILCSKEVNIGNNVLIGANSIILDSDIHHSDPKMRESTDSVSRPVNIQNNVFIGFNCTILKGVTIGENSVIGANSLVISNIPSNSIALGNPCKVLMKRKITENES